MWQNRKARFSVEAILILYKLYAGCHSHQALLNNPKIEVVEGDKYLFCPALNVRDRKGLLRLLDKHDQRGLGGILMDDVEESLPRTQKVIKVSMYSTLADVIAM